MSRVHATFRPLPDGQRVAVVVASRPGSPCHRETTVGVVPVEQARALRDQVRALRTTRPLTVAERAALLRPMLDGGARTTHATCPECGCSGWALTFRAFEALPATVRAAVNAVFWDLDAWRCAECLVNLKAPEAQEE